MYLGVRVNNLKVQEKIIQISKGGTRSDEYRAINPLGKLPCLQVLVTAVILLSNKLAKLQLQYV